MDHIESDLQMDAKRSVWAQAVAEDTGIRVASCYQCLRCTNSCPVNTFMDIKPHQVVRMVQFGQRERLLACSAIWICLSCEMCSTYCPNEIDVARLFNHLKNSVVAAQKVPAEFEIAAFHGVFLDVLKRHGRLNDLQLMQRFMWKTLLHGNIPGREKLTADLELAFELFKRKRLKLLPERSRAVGQIRDILKRYGQRGVTL